MKTMFLEFPLIIILQTSYLGIFSLLEGGVSGLIVLLSLCGGRIRTSRGDKRTQGSQMAEPDLPLDLLTCLQGTSLPDTAGVLLCSESLHHRQRWISLNRKIIPPQIANSLS